MVEELLVSDVCACLMGFKVRLGRENLIWGLNEMAPSCVKIGVCAVPTLFSSESDNSSVTMEVYENVNILVDQ